MFFPSLNDFMEMTVDNKSAAVYTELRAEFETPLGLYWKLAKDRTYSFLLESVTGGEQLGRYSIFGCDPTQVIRSKNGDLRITGEEPMIGSIADGEDPLHALRRQIERVQIAPHPHLKHFQGGAVGMISYDIVRYFEELPDTCTDDLQIDDLAMMIATQFVVFDHVKNVVRVMSVAPGTTAGYEAACKQVTDMCSRLRAPMPLLPVESPIQPVVSANQTQEQYEGAVLKVKKYLEAGDGLQMLPSIRFTSSPVAHPLTVYRALRSINPSPYMFLLHFGDFELIGASPEVMVSLHKGEARVRPIAGTRWRGKTEAEDNALADELINDKKERAEHVMLIDLGRNDLGRVCEYGTINVRDLMVIERYSHVMHIVSDVRGALRSDLNGYDLIRATFPAGTVSGAPKVRAMQIIDELEPTRRGSYAGAVGVIGFDGDLDTCITLRTILRKDGKAFVQAGGGVVYDSDPTFEYNESCNKAKAALSALTLAGAGLD